MRKVLIRHNVKKHLFWDGDRWTDDEGLACKFPTTLDGISFALQHNIKDAEVLLHFDGTDPIAVPLT